MKSLNIISICRFSGWMSRVVVVIAAVLSGVPAEAGLIVVVGTGHAAPGSTGNRLEVTLTNTGPGAVELAGFSFGLTALSSPEVTITEATIGTTDPYIFAGHSTFGPTISVSPPPAGLALLASDLYDSFGSGVTLAAGTTVGLGAVFYNVVAGTGPLSVDVVLDLGSTTLSSSTGADVPIETVTNGQIIIATVPEPSSLALTGTGTLLGLAVAWSRRGSRASRSRSIH